MLDVKSGEPKPERKAFWDYLKTYWDRITTP
jgi:hypothetical protein